MDDEVNWNLLAKHLFGECSHEEAARIRSWIAEDPVREALLEELRQVYRMTDASTSLEEKTPWDTDSLWKRVREQTTEREETGRPQNRTTRKNRVPETPPRAFQQKRARGRPSSRATRSYLRLRKPLGAAVALVVAALALLWLYPSAERNPAVASEAKVFVTKEGQRVVIRLTDGTRVHLNVDSRLTRPAKFGMDRRVVHLEGEAFFEVAKDSTRPFLVHAGEATTRVLGTAFNVSAYPGDEGTTVVVEEGRVSLHPEKPGAPLAAREDAVLMKSQMGKLLQSGEQVVRRDVDASQYLAWTEGQLVFEEAPLQKVTRTLERWYGLTITMDGSSAPPPGHLNAHFAEDQPLSEVLRVVATAFGLEYDRQGERVTFTLATSPPEGS